MRGQRGEHDDREQHPGQGARADRGNGEEAPRRITAAPAASALTAAAAPRAYPERRLPLPTRAPLLLDGGESPAGRAEGGELGRPVEQLRGRGGEVAAQRGEVAFLPAGQRDRDGGRGERRDDQRRREDQPGRGRRAADQATAPAPASAAAAYGQPHPEPAVGE